MLAEVAFVLIAAVAHADSVPTASMPAPSPRELVEIREQFTFHGEARISRDGLRSIVSEPRFRPQGIDYREVINEDGWPAAAQTLPRPLRWAEIDTLWRKNSRAGIGALAGGVLIAPIAASWGHDRWPAQEDAFLVIASGAAGAVAGGLLGAMVGGAWYVWEPIRTFARLPRERRASP
jgi:hypothetical protein